jgi:hypothetical protein
MAGLGSFLFGSMKRGNLHDYTHAAQIFRTNNYARAPREKWQFQVNFVLNPSAMFGLSTAELSYLVKSVDLPKFTVEAKDMNQYNRKTWVQTKIKYEPVSIKFHDDNSNHIREFWRSYYTYYYTDGNYQQNTYSLDDRYISSGQSVNPWGLDSGATAPFLSSIEIYSMHGGISNKITLMNPVITNFSHDSHDYSQTQEFMEASMQIHYTGVTYSQGYAAGIAGFADPMGYDITPSSITGQNVGYVLDPATGNLIQPTGQFINPGVPYNAMVTPDYNNYNPSGTVGLTPIEIQNILRNQNTQLTQFSFPIANSVEPAYSQNASISPVYNSVGISNGQIVDNGSGTIYSVGTLPYTLAQQGYTQPQIIDAVSYVKNQSLKGLLVGTAVQAALKYLLSPSSQKSNKSNASNVNFANPTNGVTPAPGTDWKQQLADRGYSAGDIKKAEDQLSKINVSPDADKAAIAVSYIEKKTGQVPLPSARPDSTTIEPAFYSNKQYQTNQNITNAEYGYSGGAGRGAAPAGVPQGVNPTVFKSDVTTELDKVTTQKENVQKQIDQVQDDVANGRISEAAADRYLADLNSRKEDLSLQENTLQNQQIDALSTEINPQLVTSTPVDLQGGDNMAADFVKYPETGFPSNELQTWESPKTWDTPESAYGVDSSFSNDYSYKADVPSDPWAETPYSGQYTTDYETDYSQTGGSGYFDEEY